MIGYGSSSIVQAPSLPKQTDNVNCATLVLQAATCIATDTDPIGFPSDFRSCACVRARLLLSLLTGDIAWHLQLRHSSCSFSPPVPPLPDPQFAAAASLSCISFVRVCARRHLHRCIFLSDLIVHRRRTMLSYVTEFSCRRTGYSSHCPPTEPPPPLPSICHIIVQCCPTVLV